MPSEMFERGRRDAEANALDDNYYHYYYDYKQGYDQVMRSRRRTQRQQQLSRAGYFLLRALPVLLLLVVAVFAGVRYLKPTRTAAIVEIPTHTPRPTLVPPTPQSSPTVQPSASPTPPPGLAPNNSAIVSGTGRALLLCRKEPGTDKPVVARLPEGKIVKLLEGPKEANGLQWWRIEVDGKSGWSAEPFLKPAPTPTPGR
ncbi:MAG TPA: SH3 domain-containing protein [Herpetosiphonaceae bacterium]|nr:SH3 domain-containing protein [Herpetosiphonaceae bacterium]